MYDDKTKSVFHLKQMILLQRSDFIFCNLSQKNI